MESMDLGHEPIPCRDGGTAIIPRWPQDHAIVDRYIAIRGTEMTNLAAMFAEQQTSQIDWHGPLYGLYELPSTISSAAFTFVSSTSNFRQGLRIKIRGGSLTVDGVTATEFVLWRDTAPDMVEVEVAWKSTGTRSLRIWNCWEHNGVMHAWMGNAGMRVDDDCEGGIRLRCSDGEGEPDFTDLVAEVQFR